MFNISPKIVETLMEDEVLCEDFDETATRCLIRLQQNVADLNTFLLANRDKKITDKRREKTTQLIANMIFYTAILLHLYDVPPDMFDMSNDAEEGIIHITEEFNESFRHSPLLLGTFMMGTVVEMGQLMWQEDFDESVSSSLPLAEATATPIEIPEDPSFKNFMEAMLAETVVEEDPDYGDIEFTIDSAKAEMLFDTFENFLAAIMIMADLCDIDLGVCMYNASQQTKI